MEKADIKQLIGNEVAPYLIGLRNEIKGSNALLSAIGEGLQKIDEWEEENARAAKTRFFNNNELKQMKDYVATLVPRKGVDYFTADDTKFFLDAVTPKKGLHYFTDEEVDDFVSRVTPIKGKDYFDGENGRTPIKGIDYFTEDDVQQLLKAATPVKGIHYNDGAPGAPGKKGKDGTEISAEDIRNKLESLKGTARLSYKAIKGLKEYISEVSAQTKGYSPVMGAGSSDGGGGDGSDSITGLIQEGTNVSITGSGTPGDPYVINALGGGSTTYLTDGNGTHVTGSGSSGDPYMVNITGGRPVILPQLQLSIVQQGQGTNVYGEGAHGTTGQTIQLGIYWSGADDAFLAYNPKIYLFRYRARGRKSATIGRCLAKYAHPPHQNGIDHPNSMWWGGEQKDNAGNLIPPFDTEFDIAAVPFQKSVITIDPKKWYGLNTSSASDVFPMKIQDWEDYTNAANTRPRGSRKYNGQITTKALHFKFAVVIENPDPAKAATIPYVIGQYSDTLHIMPKFATFDDGTYVYAWKARIGEYAKAR
jgi:hypothetical protein